jgi:hypothetical protein
LSQKESEAQAPHVFWEMSSVILYRGMTKFGRVMFYRSIESMSVSA